METFPNHCTTHLKARRDGCRRRLSASRRAAAAGWDGGDGGGGAVRGVLRAAGAAVGRRRAATTAFRPLDGHGVPVGGQVAGCALGFLAFCNFPVVVTQCKNRRDDVC